MFLRIPWAFLRRDAVIHTSYKLGFTLDLMNVFFDACQVFFLARLVGEAVVPALKMYGGDYFAFLILGLASSTYQTVGLNSFSQSLRQEQFLNTLEPVLLAPVTIPQLLFGSALWDFLYATVQVGLSLFFGMAIFGLRMPDANLGPAAMVLALSFFSFMGLGVLSAAFIMRFKRGTPITWMVTVLGNLLGGTYYPIEIFPDWLRRIALFVPQAHTLSGLRMSLLAGAGWREVLPHLTALALFSLILWPLGIWAFGVALRKARADGSLGHY